MRKDGGGGRERKRKRYMRERKYHEKFESDRWGSRRREKKKDWEKDSERKGSKSWGAFSGGLGSWCSVGFTVVVDRELTVVVAARGFWWWRLRASLARLRERDKEREKGEVRDKRKKEEKHGEKMED